MYHRHIRCTTTTVLEGELRVWEQLDGGGEVVKVKSVGSCSRDGENEVHMEGSGDDDAIIVFAMRTDGEVIYEPFNDDLTLRRAITVKDFHRD